MLDCSISLWNTNMNIGRINCQVYLKIIAGIQEMFLFVVLKSLLICIQFPPKSSSSSAQSFHTMKSVMHALPIILPWLSGNWMWSYHVFCYFKLKLGEERLKIVTLLTLCITEVWVSHLIVEKIPWSITICPASILSPSHPLLPTLKYETLHWIALTVTTAMFFYSFLEFFVGHNYVTLPQSRLNYIFGWSQQKGQSLILPIISNAIWLVTFKESCTGFWHGRV